MFFTLNISEGKTGVKGKVYDLFHKPRVQSEKVKEENCLEFYQINAEKYKGKIPWKEIEEAAGKLFAKGIFSLSVSPNASSKIKRYEGGIFLERVLFKSAVKTIEKMQLDALNVCVTVFDENAYLCDLVESLVYLCANIQIVTACVNEYEKLAEKLMSKYGISLYFLPSQSSEILKSTFIISHKSDLIPKLFKGVVFTNENRRFINATVIKGENISLPEKYRKYLPNGASQTQFACALYELCGAKEFSNALFEDMHIP